MPNMLTATVLPSLAKIETFIVAVRLFFEILVTRADAPALPNSELKLMLSNRNDLLCIEFDLAGNLLGVTEGTARPDATQIKLHVSF
jgi:hypothetical protein